MSTSTPVTFPGSLGSPLEGLLHRPAGTVRGTALFAHCFTCSKDVRAARRIAESLCARGFGVLRFDFTGLGQSLLEMAERCPVHRTLHSEVRVVTRAG